MSTAQAEKKYEVTDELRKFYPDLTITVNKEELVAGGYPQIYVDKLVELMPMLVKTIKDMSIIEAEYLNDKTGLGSMFEGMNGMEDAKNYLRMEAYKVAVENNKTKVFAQFQEQWNKMAAKAAEMYADSAPGM